jgi:hypothetical protein
MSYTKKSDDKLLRMDLDLCFLFKASLRARYHQRVT